MYVTFIQDLGVSTTGNLIFYILDCLFEGRMVLEEKTVSISDGDICRLCTCYAGEMICHSVHVAYDCPKLECKKIETLPEDCCPVCSGQWNNYVIEALFSLYQYQ